MRILLDATAVPSDRGGVGRYVDELLPALARQGVDLVVACQARDAAATSALVPTAEIVTAPALTARRPVRMAWEQVGLPRLVRSSRAQVLHSPHYTMPRLAGVPVVVTLHDATFFSHPDLHHPVKARFFRSAIRTAVRHAAGLVVPSEATRDEVRRFAGGRVDQFQVAYHGVDANVFHVVDAAAQGRVRESLGLGDRPYVGFLGTLEPRKNVPALIRAWVRAVEGTVDPPALVLVGGRGWDTGVDPAIAAVPAGLTVLRPGYLPLGDLPGFLSGARVLAYPSLGEGFGLPVLEAMACGAAVLTTRELSLPEVGGAAVAYCGTDEASIAAGLGALLADDARRAELSAAAIARAAAFTWDAAAAVHVAAYASARRRA
ncbi:glycosyltransferase family 4 protein [Pengzhenrongella frigida]|uniref:Glycosyltransferase family 1 protein n=1 Tax=Pengzhenrongella frigida TaxID=1259133 RepID=A0A4Q5N050_9MICO|nr:glycosyltransferase family 1 protein [Cellulomonas sp. HLT2-17]RYV51385.1 glycosyltransferase family 1 protein [Cellulomonas sp. HLT2-17]